MTKNAKNIDKGMYLCAFVKKIKIQEHKANAKELNKIKIHHSAHYVFLSIPFQVWVF